MSIKKIDECYLNSLDTWTRIRLNVYTDTLVIAFTHWKGLKELWVNIVCIAFKMCPSLVKISC